MLTKIHHFSIFLILISCAALPSRAADLTLDAAVSEALARHPEMRAIEASVAGAAGGVTTASTWANPELSMAPGITRTRDGGTAKSEFHGNFELNQLFEFPGKRALKIAIAEKNVALQKLALEGFRFQLSSKVRRAFYEMLAAQKIVALRREQVSSAKTFVEAATKRAASGYGSDFETVKSRADLISAQRDLLESQGAVEGARVGLNTLLGRRPSGPLEVAGKLENLLPSEFSKRDFVSLAMVRHPSLRSLAMQAESAGLNLRASRLGRRPDFAVGPQVEYSKDEQIYGIGVTITLPFFDQKKGEIASATAEQRRVEAEIEMTRLEISGAIAKSKETLRIAGEQLALYTPAFLDQLKGFVAQAEQSYAQSATTLIIYLDARRTYFDTLAQYYASLGNVAEQRAELEAAVGTLLDLNP